jgi:hypothetical protein
MSGHGGVVVVGDGALHKCGEGVFPLPLTSIIIAGE